MSLGFIVGTGAGKNTPAFSYRIPLELLTVLSPTAGALCYDSHTRLMFILREIATPIVPRPAVQYGPAAQASAPVSASVRAAILALIAEMESDLMKVRASGRRYRLSPEQWPVCLNTTDLDPTPRMIPQEKAAAWGRAVRIDNKAHEELHAYGRYKDAQIVEKITRETGIVISMNEEGNRRHVDRITLIVVSAVVFDFVRDLKTTNSRLLATAKRFPRRLESIQNAVYRFANKKVGTWGGYTTIAEEILARIEGFGYVEEDLYREGKGSPFDRDRFRNFVLDNLAAIYGGLLFDVAYVALKQRGISPRDVLDQAYEYAAPLIRRDAQRACVTRSRRKIAVGETVRLYAPGFAQTDAAVRRMFLTWDRNAKGGHRLFGKATCTVNVQPVGSQYDFEVQTKFTEKAGVTFRPLPATATRLPPAKFAP